MSTLLAQIADRLAAEAIPFAVIGATAMAAHGVSRATRGIDVLATDPRALSRDVWDALQSNETHVEIRRGDDDDPLLGVIRIRSGVAGAVDVIVGRDSWQAALIRRALPVPVEGVVVPVAGATDLILLKLYAGGVQDRWDIAQLVAVSPPEVLAAVRARLQELPEACTTLWNELERA